IWTCSMHPQIRMNEPGKCPICGMDLIPLIQGSKGSDDPAALHLTKEAARLASVMTSTVARQKTVKEVLLYGKVMEDERLNQSQVTHVSGRIEKLYVSFTGEPVKEGQLLAQIYSPELITAQQELLEAAKIKVTQPELYNAAREKLRQLKLTDEQAESIERTGTVQTYIDIVSNTSGIVTSKPVNTGDYVTRGSVLFTVAGLSKVWILFEAYESDLPFIRENQSVTFTLRAFPGKKFSGKVSFIDPVVNPVTRVTGIRVEAPNNKGELKPGMFASGIIFADLSEYSNSIVIPESAVLWTGSRSVVWLRLAGNDEPVFIMRQVTLGPSTDKGYVVLSGLSEGDEIVVNGAFSIDAAAQLEMKPSMMNAEGYKTASPHNQSVENMAMEENKTQTSMHSSFHVSGNCEMCRDRIENAAKSVRGVITSRWSVESKMFQVSFDASLTNETAIRKAIAAAGHDNEGFMAPDSVYEKLPACCRYRN
ncbi:MAG TPA: efflux RND transporter periplasmic adaptor subunit, partial [Bacteroidales bacterium]|nr:efflux RND transporter periplasmic adaptor subunit [Bacteroidales bacterium]